MPTEEKKKTPLEELRDMFGTDSDMVLDIPVEEDDLILETWEGTPESPVPSFETMVDAIKKSLAATLKEMEPYRLAPRAKQIIEDFLTFHTQSQRLGSTLPESRKTYFNLLIRSDSRVPADALVTALRESLGIGRTELQSYSEEALLQQFDSYRPGRRTSLSPFPDRCKLIYIHSCQAPPQVNSDAGTSAAINDARKKQELYRQAWQALFEHLRENPQVILIACAEDAVYRTDLRRNNDLFYRVCSNHIFIPPCTQEDLGRLCLRKLKDTSFTLGPGFEEELKKYFEAVYPKAELRDHEFVDDLLRRIYALYLCKPRKTAQLTVDCIPKYQSQVISPEDILGQLGGLIGLGSVKAQFRDIYRMQLMGLNQDKGKNRFHMVFSGNPGTGKTTVAQMAADLFYRMGILKTNRLVMTKPTELISQWIGGTGIKTSEVIRQAYDGVLFIDEAYGLADSKNGPEALNVLIQEMENNADRLIVILAGYKEQMRQLMDINPGLSSRIGRTMEFADYTTEELVQIFHYRCRQDGFTLAAEAQTILTDCLNARMTGQYFGNAREVNTILQRLKEAWSREYYEVAQEKGGNSDQIPRVLCARHFAELMPQRSQLAVQDLVGLNTLKDKLEQFKRQAAYQKHLREKNMRTFPDFSLHMLFMGNPGTGKTTVAKLIAQDLYSIGILKTNHLTVASRKDLVSQVVGETAPMVTKLIKQAAGGVLFIDEAYTLIPKSDRDPVSEAVEVLLTAMEEHKSDTVFIFAGYDRDMMGFLESNPGIRSRIGYTFHFDDYTTEELMEIFRRKIDAASLTITDEALEKVEAIMEYFRGARNFGNGRFVNHVFQQVILLRSGRDFTEQYRDITQQDVPDIKALIQTAPDSMQLYDPGKITEKMQLRTAYHELGHAMVQYVSEPDDPPEAISIRNQAGSFGRVRLAAGVPEMTEEELLNRIATALGGLHAEKVFLGNHTTGCASDYAKARSMAAAMLRDFAMDTYGRTEKQILKAAADLAQRILTEHRDAIEACVPILMEKQELTGEEFVALLKT